MIYILKKLNIMRKFIFFIFLFQTLLTFAQINESFSDGDFTTNPAWTGNVAMFEVIDPPTSGAGAINADANNDNNVLRSKPSMSDAVLTTSSNVAYGEWIFSVADGQGWSVSKNNDYKIILISNTDSVNDLMDDSLNFNGYFLEFDGGASDKFVLYKQTATAIDTVINTGYPENNDGSSAKGRTIKVTRSAIGDWSVFIDEGFATSATTQRGSTVNDTTHTASSFFGIATNIKNPNDGRVLYFDNLKITPLPTNDTTTEITAGADPEPQTISSLVNSSAGIQVFDFQLNDEGTDGLPTIVNSLSFGQANSNQIVDFTELIAGAKLFGTDLPDGIDATITENKITFSPVNITVENSTTETYQLKIWLKTDLSEIQDNSNLVLSLDSSDFVCDLAGSSVGVGHIESGNTNLAIDIQATQLTFLNVPNAVSLNRNFILKLIATDQNGNVDMDANNAVSLALNSGIGNLSSASGLTANLNQGRVEWFDLQYDTLGVFSIKASSTGLPEVVSNDISCQRYVSFLIENFEDGNIENWTTEPAEHWVASSEMPINGSFSGHVNFQPSDSGDYSDKMSHAMTGFDLNADSSIWLFEIKYTNSSPSGKNSWYVFLTADADLQEMKPAGAVNGYVVGLNFDCSDDIVKLWSVTNGVATPIIATDYNWNNIDEKTPKSFAVSRSISGNWEMLIDENGGFDELVSYGTGVENTLTNTSFFGVIFNYTKNNSLKFWIDDIYVGHPIPDTVPPVIEKLEAVAPNKIKLYFNEDIDSASVENLENYIVDNHIGNPQSVTLNPLNLSNIELVFDADFEEQIFYEIMIKNIKDVAGNTMENTIKNFEWQNLKIEKVIFVADNQLDIKFSKRVAKAAAEQTNNYQIVGALGNPTSAKYDSAATDLVHLTFADNFELEQSYTLHIENVEDIFGNLISPVDYDFIYYRTKRFDLIINELMVDVKPAPVALPANKYIEILNTTNYDIDLTNWSLQIEGKKPLIFTPYLLESNKYAIICSEEAQMDFIPYGNVLPFLKESYLTSSSGKKITIRNAAGKIIEQIYYNPAEWYKNPDKEEGGWSMERIDPTNFCNQIDNWRASENYTGGTPGFENSVFSDNPDLNFPTIEHIEYITSCDISITFSENIDSVEAETTYNYILNRLLSPIEVKFDVENATKVHLHFADHFNFGDNELEISNISDYCSNIMPDTTILFNYKRIYAIDAEPKSTNQLKIYFSEPVSKASAENIVNYSVNNEIGMPSVAVRDEQDSNIVHLMFNAEFQIDTCNELVINDIYDVNGGDMEEAHVNFLYHIPAKFDVVFNELMLDVKPAPTGLPEAQYLELFNTTDYPIWLSDWQFETQDKRVFPAIKIEPKDFVVLCKESDKTKFADNHRLISILETSDLSQNGREIKLLDAKNNLITYLKYSNKWYADETKAKGGWSLEKIDPFNFCESGFNWRASIDIAGGTPFKQNSIFAINPDTVGVKLAEIKVKSSKELVLRFTKNISFENGLLPENYTIENFGNPSFVALSDTNNATVNLFFTNQFAAEQEYNLTVNNVSDDCDNTILPTTKQFVYHLIYPEFIWCVNQNQLEVKFSEEVNYNTAFDDVNYVVDNQIGSPIHIVRKTQDPSVIFLQFPTNFANGVTYNLTISNLQDINGNVMNEATMSFVYYKAKPNDVVLNEILFNPFTGGKDFVELYNRSVYPINLIDLKIAKRDDEGLLQNIYQISTDNYLLQPSEYITLTIDTNNIQETYTCGKNFIQLKNMPSYPDGYGTVVICDGADSVIDEFSYNSDWHFALISDQSGVSLERIDFNKPTQDSANWHSASENVGFATPGLVNSQYKNTNVVVNEGVIELEPEVFSPDNDGYNDQLYINYKFEQGGYVATVTIFDRNGYEVRKLANDELIGDSGYWIWDGLDNANQKARIGMYVVYVKVFDLSGKVNVYRKTAVIATKTH